MTSLLSRSRDPRVESRPAAPRGRHLPLLAYAALAGVLALVCCAGLLLDDRTVLGEPTWLKPLKFTLSFGVYALTLAWMYRMLPRWRRTVWWLGTGLTAALVVETVAIVFQAARGRASHFNVGTPLDARVLDFMAGAAIALVLLTLLVGVFLLLQRLVDRPMAWALRCGIALAVVGMAVTALMTDPTPDQLAAMERGAEPALVGSHDVGPTGDHMPLTGWNASGGDLRIGHFAGLHAMQSLPLVAVALAALAPRWRPLRAEGTRTGLVVVAALAHLGLVGLVTWQALRGQALLQPDAATLLAAAGLGLATLLAGAGVLWAGRLRERRGAAS
ncbi:hypothetical protein [Marinitenerispora sediminis]|uniref:hypothetical protein n=1 Tax=Marinitenerispora sediminis TaxID=1931232 RepID=UPI0011C02B11|nr:hypothetical protein [Marinitenerispora sediminis]